MPPASSFPTLALSLVTVVLCAATLIPLSRHPAWWVRGLDFPRLQLAVLLAGSVGATLVLLPLDRPSTQGLLAVQSAGLLYQAWWILPYTPFHPWEVRAASSVDVARRLRIVTANVLMTNRNAEGLLDLVRRFDPDVLVTLETDGWWEARLAALGDTYPYRIACPQDDLYGMHVWSKLALEDARVEFLVEQEVPSMHARIRLRSGAAVRAHFLHPAPPSPTENPESSERDAELLIVGQSVSDEEGPVVIAGDLNDVAWSRTTRLFRRISGLLDPRVGRGLYNTFHADHPLLRWPLDHLFHSDHFALARIERLPPFGSDHFALLAELVLDRDRRTTQRGLEADAEDRARAARQAREEGVSDDDVPEPGARRG